MKTTSSLQSYSLNYDQNKYVLQQNESKVIIDLMHNANDLQSKPLSIFDLDHTLLDMNGIKTILNKAFENHHPSFSDNTWRKSYESAKSLENYYDYLLHIEQLAEKSQLSKQQLLDLTQQSIEKCIKDIQYLNLIQEIKKQKDNALIILTSGMMHFQKIKVAAIIPHLPVPPQAIIYVEKYSKGNALNYAINTLHIPPTVPITVYDDNPRELEDIHDHTNRSDIFLIRVKQPMGNYNQREFTKKIQVEELDFTK